MQSLFGRIPQPKPRMTVRRRAKEKKKAVVAIPTSDAYKNSGRKRSDSKDKSTGDLD